MNKYDIEIPKRNWRRFWGGYLSHFIEGVVIGVLVLTPYFIAGIALLLLIVSYQGLEYQRRKDTPGRDMFDIGLGVMVGLIGSFAYLAHKGFPPYLF